MGVTLASVKYTIIAMPVERILFYETGSGRRPVIEALEELEDGEQARVLEAIEAFTEEFPLVRTVTIRPLVGKLWEMKIGRIRVLYGVVAGVLCVVLLFVKKSQKTPSGELELAVRRLEEMTEELKS